MRSILMTSAVAAIAALCAPSASAGDAADFEAMCTAVSQDDGLPPEAIGGFCSCMAESAAGDDDIYAELWETAHSEPDPDARMSMLSSDAQSVVQSCKGA